MGTPNPIRRGRSFDPGMYPTRLDAQRMIETNAAGVDASGNLTITIGNAPASATAAGTPGTIIFASSGIYVCTAENTWSAYTPAVIWP
ncbi:hypothetical protein [Komagataeibacter oboediens]|uniref:hypothetical protein n=1 Tax=Komagataeibacter oboediens TaxID=65958 RepID=UPI001C2D02E1|nr:hypothetical protein [Komagataeibacter oboediens]MBV1825328.1 hypothetical protein [Komagataeibacter oboediens]